MKNQLIILAGFFLVVSCSKNDDSTIGRVVNENIQQVININNGDTLKVTLGSFGDEEGAWIFKNPQNAKVSKVYRQVNSGLVLYEYYPNDSFIGKDTVELILNRGSDGASLGINDTTRICITVK